MRSATETQLGITRFKAIIKYTKYVLLYNLLIIYFKLLSMIFTAVSYQVKIFASKFCRFIKKNNFLNLSYL